MPPQVMLTESEIRMAIVAGQERRIAAARRQYEDKSYDPSAEERLWDMDIEGAAAEMAFCKFRDHYWTGSLDSFKSADVGKQVQIRHTRNPNGHLILRPGDNPAHYYVLVTGRIPSFTIPGWILGTEAMSPDYAANPHGAGECWMVPQTKLSAWSRGPEARR